MANGFACDDYVPVIHESAFIHPNATITGNVIIGRDVYVGPGAAIRGDWGAVVIEDGCNVHLVQSFLLPVPGRFLFRLRLVPFFRDTADFVPVGKQRFVFRKGRCQRRSGRLCHCLVQFGARTDFRGPRRRHPRILGYRLSGQHDGLVSGRRTEIVPLGSFRTLAAMRALTTLESFAAFEPGSFPWSFRNGCFRFGPGKLRFRHAFATTASAASATTTEPSASLAVAFGAKLGLALTLKL